jgi:ribosomal protein L37AE/L43A
MVKIPKQLSKFGSRFAFEFFLETAHDGIVQALQRYLSDITPEKIRVKVRNSEFPSIKHLSLEAVGDNLEHIEKISLVRLVELIGEARPDLVAAIQDMGEEGVGYLVKLRQHILDQLKNAEFKLEQGMVLAHCEECGKKWPVKKEGAASITKCPFCGAGGEETRETPASGESPEPPNEEE